MRVALFSFVVLAAALSAGVSQAAQQLSVPPGMTDLHFVVPLDPGTGTQFGVDGQHVGVGVGPVPGDPFNPQFEVTIVNKPSNNAFPSVISLLGVKRSEPGASVGGKNMILRAWWTKDEVRMTDITELLPTYDANGLVSFSYVSVPEPATWAIMLLGFAGLGAALRARSSRRQAA